MKLEWVERRPRTRLLAIFEARLLKPCLIGEKLKVKIEICFKKPLTVMETIDMIRIL